MVFLLWRKYCFHIFLQSASRGMGRGVPVQRVMFFLVRLFGERFFTREFCFVGAVEGRISILKSPARYDPHPRRKAPLGRILGEQNFPRIDLRSNPPPWFHHLCHSHRSQAFPLPLLAFAVAPGARPSLPQSGDGLPLHVHHRREGGAWMISIARLRP